MFSFDEIIPKDEIFTLKLHQITKNTTSTSPLQVWHDNSVWCRALHVLTTYLTMTNYTWMLCEGAYLHFLLVMPFLQE